MSSARKPAFSSSVAQCAARRSTSWDWPVGESKRTSDASSLASASWRARKCSRSSAPWGGDMHDLADRQGQRLRLVPSLAERLVLPFRESISSRDLERADRDLVDRTAYRKARWESSGERSETDLQPDSRS